MWVTQLDERSRQMAKDTSVSELELRATLFFLSKISQGYGIPQCLGGACIIPTATFLQRLQLTVEQACDELIPLLLSRKIIFMEGLSNREGTFLMTEFPMDQWHYNGETKGPTMTITVK